MVTQVEILSRPGPMPCCAGLNKYLIRMGVRELLYILNALFERIVALYPTLLVC